MRISIVHLTRLDYSADVIECVTEARLGPLSDVTQHWQSFELRASPNAAINQFFDGFGNSTHLITLAVPHRYLEMVARSSVLTLTYDPFQLPVEPVAPLSPAEKSDYLAPSSLIPQQAELELLASHWRACSTDEAFDAVRSMMDFVHREFEYASQVTDVGTTVADVLRLRRGVCQDFAHVLIGLCRALSVPARYVSGYLVGAHRGAQASHAWVEAFTPSHGWRGFDPTNNLVASEQHVKMAVGRDYRDVAPTRGTYRGNATETINVWVETTGHPA
jgi:transglutaminase-like putative cysteine protease